MEIERSGRDVRGNVYVDLDSLVGLGAVTMSFENRGCSVRPRLQGLFAVAVMAGVLGTLVAPAWAQGTGGFGAAPAHPSPADPPTRAYFKPVIAAGSSKADEVLVTSTSNQPTHL